MLMECRNAYNHRNKLVSNLFYVVISCLGGYFFCRIFYLSEMIVLIRCESKEDTIWRLSYPFNLLLVLLPVRAYCKTENMVLKITITFKVDGMGGAYSTHGRYEKLIQK
jgi:hypothetical protein